MIRSLFSRLTSFIPTLAQTQSEVRVASQCQRAFCSENPFNFDKDSEETLESLSEKFEDILEADSRMGDSDVSLSNGVLTVDIPEFGTYVINKQGPNKQIWLSSPLSGPARFDFVGNTWVYKHTNESLHDLLEREIGATILKTKAGFRKCYLGGAQHQDNKT